MELSLVLGMPDNRGVLKTVASRRILYVTYVYIVGSEHSGSFPDVL